MLSIVVSLTASLRKMLVAGPYILVVSNCTHSRYSILRRLANVTSSSFFMCFNIYSRNFAQTSGCSQMQYISMFVNRLVESFPAAMKAQNSQMIQSSSRGERSFCPLDFKMHMAQKISVYFYKLPVFSFILSMRFLMILFTSSLSFFSLLFSSLYFFLKPKWYAFSPSKSTSTSVDWSFASFRIALKYLLIDTPSTIASTPSPPKKILMTILEIISPNIFLSSTLYSTSSEPFFSTSDAFSILSTISLQISLILGTFLLIKSKLKISDSTFLFLFHTSPQLSIIVLPSAILKPYLLRCDLWMILIFSGAKRYFSNLGWMMIKVIMQDVLLRIMSQFFQECFQSWKASLYYRSLCFWFQSSMILNGSYGKHKTLQPIVYKVSLYHFINLFGLTKYLSQKCSPSAITTIAKMTTIIFFKYYYSPIQS